MYNTASARNGMTEKSRSEVKKLRRQNMKFIRLIQPVFLITLSTVAFAQSDAQKSFDTLKNLAGSWEGHVTTDPKQAGMGDNALMQVSMRVTSRGNALVHEMKGAGTPDDPTRYDHPVTM